MQPYLESIVRGDVCEVVICDLTHRIVYMNPAAVKVYGELTGTSIFDCHNSASNARIQAVVAWFQKAPGNDRVHTFYNTEKNKDIYMVALRDAGGKLIGYYEKHEFRTRDDTPLYDLP